LLDADKLGYLMQKNGTRLNCFAAVFALTTSLVTSIESSNVSWRYG